MSTELTTTQPNKVQEFAAFGSEGNFATVQRMAKCLSSSSIVPVAFQGEQNIGNCVIALEMSHRMGASPLAIMQSIYIVHGKPGWASTFLIANLNSSQRFTPLRFKVTGTKGKDDFGCIATATDKSSGEDLEGPEVTIAMAKAEGWYGKNGSKWPNMPELMLRYRAATFFVRLYAPETTMGIQSAEELSDVLDVESTVSSPEPAKPSFKRTEKTKEAVIEATPAPSKNQATSPAPEPNPAPAPAPKQKAMHPPAHDTRKAAPEKQPELTVVKEPEPEPTPEPEQESDLGPVAGDESPQITNLRAAMKDGEVTSEQLIAFCVKKGALKEGADKDLATLDDILVSKLPPLTRMIQTKATAWKEMKGL